MSVVTSDITSLTELALGFLEVAENALAETTEGTPTRSYLSPAAPPYDCCPMLTVHVAALSEEATEPLSPIPATGRRHHFQRVNLATLQVTVLRCTPHIEGNDLPAISELQAAAEQIEQDGWILWNALNHAIQDNVFKSYCEIVHVDAGVSIPEQGGCAGWLFTIRAELGGIPNPEGS